MVVNSPIMFLVEIPMDFDPKTVTLDQVFQKIADYFSAEAARLSLAESDDRWPTGTGDLRGYPVECAVGNQATPTHSS